MEWSHSSSVVFLALCVGLLMMSSAAMAQQRLVPAYFVFGDSLADPGNNNYIRTLSKADSPPNGVDFPGRQATGRYCNGRTTVDILTQILGIPDFLPPYLAPDTKGQKILNGVNYASGAAGILDSSGYLFVGRIPFNKQLEYFTNTKSQFVQLLGEQATADILSKSLFSIILGANDYLNNYYQPLSPVGNLTPEQLSTMLVNNFTAQLTTLYNLGARKVALAALGPIGCIPYQLTLRFRRNGQCDPKVNAEAQLFNSGVLGMVNSLNANLPGAKFIILDAYKGVTDMIANPAAHGFTIVDKGCCGAGGPYNGLLPCLPNMTFCFDRYDYLFWDAYHPSEKANIQLANSFFAGTEYAYPINIKQLIQS